MDLVIFSIIAIVLTFTTMKAETDSSIKSSKTVTAVVEDTTRTTKLNDAFYDDPNAFTEISRALGFPKA